MLQRPGTRTNSPPTCPRSTHLASFLLVTCYSLRHLSIFYPSQSVQAQTQLQHLRQQPCQHLPRLCRNGAGIEWWARESVPHTTNRQTIHVYYPDNVPLCKRCDYQYSSQVEQIKNKWRVQKVVNCFLPSRCCSSRVNEQSFLAKRPRMRVLRYVVELRFSDISVLRVGSDFSWRSLQNYGSDRANNSHSGSLLSSHALFLPTSLELVQGASVDTGAIVGPQIVVSEDESWVRSEARVGTGHT